MHESDQSYRDRVAAMHRRLGISDSYESHCGLPVQLECRELADAGMDVFGRPALLQADTLLAWQKMKIEAAASGITLQLVSAFRSAEYQKGIFERKLDRGDKIKSILKVNAAPGFSEHHTGRAIDIGTPGVEHLTESFEHSTAYEWLSGHALQFGFILSFPRDNQAGILYEPWHWKYSGNHI